MKELAFQKLIMQAVRSDGGFAHKMSAKFLIGVPDLFLKLASSIPGMWEVKINDCPTKSTTVKLAVTELQLKWLRDYASAGGLAGIISGLRAGPRLFIQAKRVKNADRDEPTMDVSGYRELLRGKRDQGIIDEIKRASH